MGTISKIYCIFPIRLVFVISGVLLGVGAVTVGLPGPQRLLLSTMQDSGLQTTPLVAADLAVLLHDEIIAVTVKVTLSTASEMKEGTAALATAADRAMTGRDHAPARAPVSAGARAIHVALACTPRTGKGAKKMDAPTSMHHLLASVLCLLGRSSQHYGQIVIWVCRAGVQGHLTAALRTDWREATLDKWKICDFIHYFRFIVAFTFIAQSRNICDITVFQSHNERMIINSLWICLPWVCVQSCRMWQFYFPRPYHFHWIRTAIWTEFQIQECLSLNYSED